MEQIKVKELQREINKMLNLDIYYERINKTNLIKLRDAIKRLKEKQ